VSHARTQNNPPRPLVPPCCPAESRCQNGAPRTRSSSLKIRSSSRPQTLRIDEPLVPEWSTPDEIILAQDEIILTQDEIILTKLPQNHLSTSKMPPKRRASLSEHYSSKRAKPKLGWSSQDQTILEASYTTPHLWPAPPLELVGEPQPHLIVLGCKV
jgi:hypothetical protein